jgi:hypothetical protein
MVLLCRLEGLGGGRGRRRGEKERGEGRGECQEDACRGDEVVLLVAPQLCELRSDGMGRGKKEREKERGEEGRRRGERGEGVRMIFAEESAPSSVRFGEKERKKERSV